MGRLEEKEKIKEERKELRRKKLLVFFLILIFFQGIYSVDSEYSNMMGYEREMVFGCRRINSEEIKIFLLGNEIDINDKEVRTSIQEASSETLKKTKVTLYKIRRKIQLLFKNEEFNPKGTKQI